MSSALRLSFLLATLSVISNGDIEIKNHIRLITPSNEIGAGRIEVYHNGMWGTICDEHWSQKNAEVACKQLGFKTAMYPLFNAYFGKAQEMVKIWLTNVSCSGKEESIVNCTHAGWDVVSSVCTHQKDAGVRCVTEEAPELTFLGCYIDNPHNRALKDFYANNRPKINWYNLNETVLACAKDAVNNEKNYNIFAVQHYGECYSKEGSPIYNKTKAKDKGCELGVGELSHNAVYDLGNKFDLGCWRDKGGRRRTMDRYENLRRHLGNWEDLESKLEVIVNKCKKMAEIEDFEYFAIQFWGECWLSNSDNFKMHGQSTNCEKGVGREWANYVYRRRLTK